MKSKSVPHEMYKFQKVRLSDKLVLTQGIRVSYLTLGGEDRKVIQTAPVWDPILGLPWSPIGTLKMAFLDHPHTPIHPGLAQIPLSNW